MKVNPFRPNSPVSPGMFSGRIQQIESLEDSLFQTKQNQPIHFMLTGERGIGKSSLLNYLKHIAEGDISVDDYKFNFLVIEADIEPTTTRYSLVKKIEMALKRRLGDSEKVLSFLKESWGFISRFEAAGLRLNKTEKEDDVEIFLDEFAYSFSDTIKRITSDSTNEKLVSANYDGVLILLDEADNCSKNLDLGTFLKLFIERLQKNGCEKVMVGIAGLPILHKILSDSHQSSLRLFNQLYIDRLDGDEVNYVIDRCLALANEKNLVETKISDEARNLLINASEGFPHFIQQFGYSSFNVDTDNIIDTDDVNAGVIGENGALELIGERYYKNNFYTQIGKNSRSVLRIMSVKLNEWVTRQYIKSKFKGKDSTMDTAIKSLCDKNIIISKEGHRGIYRLQQKAFAVWIKYYANDGTNIQREISNLDDGSNT